MVATSTKPTDASDIDTLLPCAANVLAGEAIELPKEKQDACDTWVKEHGASGIIKCRGEGRTVKVVHEDIKLWALGERTAAARLREALRETLAQPEDLPAVAALLAKPKEDQASLDAWVQAQLGETPEERAGLLKLRSEGRTVATVAAEVDLVIGGAKHELATRQCGPDGPELPEAKQDSCDAWVKEHGASGVIKCRGAGRTIEVVRGEIQLWSLGQKAAWVCRNQALSQLLKKPEDLPAVAALLAKPKEDQASLDAWVKAQLGETPEERAGLLKLRGEGRTVAAIAAEVDLVIGGAEFRLGQS